MTKIDLNRASTFVRVVQAASFSAAARALGLPTSSVSRSVAHLEEDLGVRLLQRTTRRLHLTEAGRRYFTRAEAALSEINDATAEVIGMGQEPRGLVRITAPVDLGLLELPAILAKLIGLHPGLELDVTITSRRVDLIEEGIDLAIRGGRLEDSSLTVRKLAPGAPAIFASRSYLERHKRPRTLADVAEHTCIRMRVRDGFLPWRFLGPHGIEEVTPRGPLITDEMLFVRYAVLEGMGLGLLIPDAVRREVASGQVVRVLPRYSFPDGGLALVWPGRRLLPARVVLVRDFLARELGGR